MANSKFDYDGKAWTFYASNQRLTCRGDFAKNKYKK